MKIIRFLSFVSFLFFSGHSFASFPPVAPVKWCNSYSNCTAWSLNDRTYDSPALACSAIGYAGPNSSNQCLNASSGAVSAYTVFSRTVAAVCPANSTGSTSCTCDAGYQENSSHTACEPIPITCPVGTVVPFDQAIGWLKVGSDTASWSDYVCVQNGSNLCQSVFIADAGTVVGTFAGVMIGASVNGYEETVIRGTAEYTGSSCGTVTPSTVTAPPPACIGQMGTVNGVQVCIPSQTQSEKDATIAAAAAQAAAAAKSAALASGATQEQATAAATAAAAAAAAAINAGKSSAVAAAAGAAAGVASSSGGDSAATMAAAINAAAERAAYDAAIASGKSEAVATAAGAAASAAAGAALAGGGSAAAAGAAGAAAGSVVSQGGSAEGAAAVGAAAGAVEGEKEGDKDDLTVTDVAADDAPTLYEPKYPDGPSGVFDAAKDQFMSSSLMGLAAALTPTITESGIPSWPMSVQVMGVNYGTYDLSPPEYVWAFLRIVIMITALFLARSLIFGG